MNKYKVRGNYSHFQILAFKEAIDGWSYRFNRSIYQFEALNLHAIRQSDRKAALNFLLEDRRRTRITISELERLSCAETVAKRGRLTGETFARLTAWLSPIGRLDQRQTFAFCQMPEHHDQTASADDVRRSVRCSHRLAIALLVHLPDFLTDGCSISSRCEVGAHEAELVEIGQTV